MDCNCFHPSRKNATVLIAVAILLFYVKIVMFSKDLKTDTMIRVSNSDISYHHGPANASKITKVETIINHNMSYLNDSNSSLNIIDFTNKYGFNDKERLKAHIPIHKKDLDWITAFNLNTTVKMINFTTDHIPIVQSSKEDPCKRCTSLKDIQRGHWEKETLRWKPRDCCFFEISPNSPETMSTWDKCIDRKSFGFYGDSTLRNIGLALLKLGNNGSQPYEIQTWAAEPLFHCGHGKIFRSDHFNFNSNDYIPHLRRAGNQIEKDIHATFDMWWTPSAYYQKPSTIRALQNDDISVVSIGVWDMGTYYRGLKPWYSSMRLIISEAASIRENKPLFIMQIHKTWTSGCNIVHDTPEGRKNYKKCLKCNSLKANVAFRNALASAVKCAHEEGHDNVHLIDTFEMTNTTFAKKRSDGVHYDNVITSMEAQFLLQSVCYDLPKNRSGEQHWRKGETTLCRDDSFFDYYQGSPLCGT